MSAGAVQCFHQDSPQRRSASRPCSPPRPAWRHRRAEGAIPEGGRPMRRRAAASGHGMILRRPRPRESGPCPGDRAKSGVLLYFVVRGTDVCCRPPLHQEPSDIQVTAVGMGSLPPQLFAAPTSTPPSTNALARGRSPSPTASTRGSRLSLLEHHKWVSCLLAPFRLSLSSSRREI